MYVKTEKIRETVEDLDFITRKYLLEESESQKRDWHAYENSISTRIKTSVKKLRPMVTKAVSSIEIINHEKRGRKASIDLETKVMILLVKHLLGLSNRSMANMMALFSFFTSIDISYKTVERLYSDPLVKMALYNLHILILQSQGVSNVDATGDATGYTLTIRVHYASHVQKHKDKSKMSSSKAQFVYSFKLMDLTTNLYIAYGVGFHSEREAYKNAMDFLSGLNTNIYVRSIRLDRYYSYPSVIDDLEMRFGKDIQIYIIPKKNSTIRGSSKWKETMSKFVNNTLGYLKEYFKRSQSESAFSQDKRRFGWRIQLKRPDRIDTYDMCTVLWHNLLWRVR